MSEAPPAADSPHACWQWLEAEGFRGFHRRAHFSMDASAIIVHGPNGTGKTSFFDAIQWLLVGDLPRLRGLRMRQTEEYIKNVYSREPARVSAELYLRGRLVHATRTGDRSSSDLSLQVDAEPFVGGAAQTRLDELLSTGTGSSLQEALFSSALLQQDDLRYVLTASPGERFEQLSRLLGLGSLERFEADAAESSKLAAASAQAARVASAQSQDRVVALRQELSQIKEEETALPGAESLLSGLAHDLELPAPRRIDIDVPTSTDEVIALSQRAGLLEERLKSVLGSVRRASDFQGDVTSEAESALEHELERAAATQLAATQALNDRNAELENLSRVLTA